MNDTQELPVTRIFEELKEFNLLPAIIFRTARKQCDVDVVKLGTVRTARLQPADKEKLQIAIEDCIVRYKLDREVIENHPHYTSLVTCGCGAHHAGQLLMWRLLLEELMTRSLLRMMIATGTVAAGVDFPARTVVITAHSKRGNDGFDTLTASELQQMSGRAGRRGRDKIGFCFVAPNRYLDARVIHEVSTKPPEPLRSAYYAAPSTVLNLLKYRNVDDLTYTVERSLAAFIDQKNGKEMKAQAEKDLQHLQKHPVKDMSRALKRLRRMERDADELALRQSVELKASLDSLEKLGFVSGGTLTEKGGWAANLHCSLVIELAQAIEAGLFEDRSVDQVVAIVACLAGDAHRPYLNVQKPPLTKADFEALTTIIKEIRVAYPRDAMSELEVVPTAASTVALWSKCESWSEFSSFLKLSNVADGDVARLVSQTADHLNQLTRLEESHPGLAKQAAEGRKRIMRPPLAEEPSDDVVVVESAKKPVRL